MSKGLLLLWLMMGIWWMSLTPAASEDTVRGFLGQSVTLPCKYPSWSMSRNSMCWGKGACPNSKCKEQLLHTDGKKVITRKSMKYTLQGSIQLGDVSLTISNTNQGDSGMYCCRIEVPGWFNDVKKTVRLELRRATTTTRPTTTSQPTTTPYVTTTMELLPTTVMTTPEPTVSTLPQTLATTVLTTAATTCPSTTPGSSSQQTTHFSAIEVVTERFSITAESETLSASKHSQRSTETTSADRDLLRPTGSKAWIPPATSQKTDEFETHLSTEVEVSLAASMTEMGRKREGNQVSSTQRASDPKMTNILIIACCAGFVVMVSSFLVLLLQGRVKGANCLQRHKRPDNSEDSKSVLDDMSHGRDDEDGIFTL